MILDATFINAALNALSTGLEILKAYTGGQISADEAQGQWVETASKVKAANTAWDAASLTASALVAEKTEAAEVAQAQADASPQPQ